MIITAAHVKPAPGEKLLAFAEVVFDDAFCCHDIKLIDNGAGPFLSFPARQLCDRCPDCGGKNQLRARYCSWCGIALASQRALHDETGRVILHADVAHPVRADCRRQITEAVLAEYDRARGAPSRDVFAAVDAWGLGELERIEARHG